MTDRLITMAGFTIMGLCLLLIAYQNIVLGRMLADTQALIANVASLTAEVLHRLPAP
jgi:hypothetical protein